jgi:hypothetical protein
MKSKEKANQLVDTYYYELESLAVTNSEILEQAKGGALMAVNEMIDFFSDPKYLMESQRDYWLDVKKEIDKIKK